MASFLDHRKCTRDALYVCANYQPLTSLPLFLSSPLQIVFEAVSTGQRGLLAIKSIILQGHQCMSTPHFLHIKGVEVNARQTATFQCTVNGRPQDSHNLWLQASQF
ncbi:unnamed protein product [Oncorhynchus mykiss]|uniref:Ig-like domain-containing protein n=1 Tax=Oncorhynchus mykiss TaxID=8022 RepID=A0A060YS05_ONCMY|nr:unnamed protein product [Oncorhynchus mykiss]